jgi:SAM-dependent methyltransferase
MTASASPAITEDRAVRQQQLFAEPVVRIDEWRDAAGQRLLRCPVCQSVIPVTVVPHLRKLHPDTWADYVRIFKEMHARGASYKTIMWRFGRAFTWLVVARELVESDGHLAELDPSKVRLDPERFAKQITTRWSFPQRGKWGVHDSRYRGNWAPEIPRNLIVRYSRRNDLVLDPFVGGGTTVLEAMALGRDAIGIDISPRAVRIASHKAEMMAATLRARHRKLPHYQIELGDARRLPLADSTVDLVCAHPPYLDIVQYTKANPADLSSIYDPARFLSELRKSVAEMSRVLKVGGICAVLVGDVRRNGALIPLGFLTLKTFLSAFDLREVVIKDQHQSAMAHFWSNKQENSKFLAIAHEYLFILEKPRAGKPLPLYLQAL